MASRASRQGQRTDLVDNVHEVAPERPAGNTEQAGLRRLRKAAEADQPPPAAWI
jgi:hypothetical protein